MVQIRSPRGRRAKEFAADELVQEGDALPKKKRGKKTLLSRIKKGSNKDTREQPSKRGGDSDYDALLEVDDDEREPPPQAPPSSPSNSSVGSKGSTIPWARRTPSIRSKGTNDRSVEVVLQDTTPKKKKSHWFPKSKSERSIDHENHVLPPTDGGNVQASTHAVDGEEAIEAVDASAVALDQVKDAADGACLYHVNLTPAMLTGLVASAKQSSAESSARCYLRIVSEVDLVDDCPGIVKSLPYQLDMGADDKKKGGKNVVVLWPNNTLTTSIGTIAYATTEADLNAFGGFDLEVGVESDDELLPLGSTTLYLDGTEAREEQVTLKIKPLTSKSPTKNPKRLKRLFRGGNEKKITSGASLEETALINIVLDVERVQDQVEEVESQQQASSWLNPGNGPLLSLILTTFSKEQATKRDINYTDQARSNDEIEGPIASGPFSCCSDTQKDEVEVGDDGSLIAAQEMLLDKTEAFSQFEETTNHDIDHGALQSIALKVPNRTPGIADSDDYTYGEEGTYAISAIDGATTQTDGISEGAGWSVSPAAASIAMCSVFSCCLGRSVVEKSASTPQIQSKFVSMNKQKSIETATVDSKTLDVSIDGGTQVESFDFTKVSNDNPMDLTLDVNGSNNTDDLGDVMMANSPLCSPCCSPCGSDNGSEEEIDQGEEEDDLQPFVLGTESLGSSPSQHQESFTKGSNRSIPNDLYERSRSNRSASSSNVAQIRKRNGSSKDGVSSSPAREDDSVYALKHGKSPGRQAPPIDEGSEAEENAVFTAADDEVDDGIQESSSDVPTKVCLRFCGEEDVTNVRSPVDAPQPMPIATQLSREQTPIIASFCMTCLGDEDISKIRPVPCNAFPSAEANGPSVETIGTRKSGSFQTRKSLEEPLILKVMSSDMTDDAERSTHESQNLEVAFSSSYESQGESYEQELSFGNSTGTSLYSKEQRKQGGWFPFFGAFGTTTAQSASEDEHWSTGSAETGSFSQGTN